ncbi:MAG TPA: ATP-binding cassette domain-containing protein [Spirochaetia bacterium]|nr:ATP-binding cassette domain-containing protein [Spirochaetia bacterium]
MLHLEGIRLQRRGRVILDDVSLIVHSGEVHGVLGQNGTGKSSLAYLELAGRIVGSALYPSRVGEIDGIGTRSRGHVDCVEIVKGAAARAISSSSPG